MNLFYIKQLALVVISIGTLGSCKKSTTQTPACNSTDEAYSSANITVYLNCNSNPIIYDSLNNTNSSGNIYSIHNVNFYISNVSIKRNDGLIYKSNRIFYINPNIIGKNTLTIDSIPKGTYNKINFLVGIDSIRNIDFGLPSTTDNLNMAWPSAMGGGYHFIKIEGHYLDSLNVNKGYAIHLGKNENTVPVIINKNLSQLNNIHNYSLQFNINEVFKNPYTYNLNIDNNYTMSDSLAMKKIKLNMQDAFSIIQNN